MKKQILLFISLLLPLVAMADDSGSCGTDVTYTYVSSTGTLTIQGSGAMTDYNSYNVPWYSYKADIKTVVIKDGVTSIGESAFQGCSGLTSVTIGNSVTSIGYRAFYNCKSLTSIEIPNSVTSIGESAFQGCSGLTSIEIPNSVTSIGVWAFNNTTWYNNQPDGLIYAGKVVYKYKGTMPGNTSIAIKEGTLGIAGGAFSGCSGLTSIEIPNSVTSIGGSAFSGCIGLPSIEIPNSVTSIGYGAFLNCTGLTSIVIPNSVTSIGESAFNGCSGLTSFTIGNSVTSIGYRAFYNCKSLTSIEIPNSVTSIGGGAFSGCSGLTSIEIPNSVTSIGEFAFEGCYRLTSIEIPNSVRSIGNYTFQYCGGLTSIEIPNSVTSIGRSAFYECTGLTSVTIPNSVTSIGDEAFRNCTSLTSVEIPNSVTSLGGGAFYGCSGLTSIEIPNSVTSIGGLAFYDCSGLTSITIPNSVTSIGIYAFEYCSALTSIEIPNSVTSIGDYAFYDCSNLTSVTVKLESPITITSYTFSNRTNATLYVPAGSKAAYQAADYWKEFKEIVEITIDDDTPDTDISSMNNVIYLNKVEASTGSQINLSIRMKNAAAIRGFQFDLYLPDGVTVVKSAKGKIVGSLSEGRLPEDDEHTLTLSEQSDGAIRFLCGSLYDETFTGNDGEIATLSVKIADDMADGNYAIILKNIKMTETDINNYYQTEYVKSTLIIKSYTLGDINDDGKIDVSDYIGIANHILGNAQEGFNVRAADVNQDGLIDVSDYIGVANIILTGSIYGNANNARTFLYEEDVEQEMDPQ